MDAREQFEARVHGLTDAELTDAIAILSPCDDEATGLALTELENESERRKAVSE